jgi:hypothetical protein
MKMDGGEQEEERIVNEVKEMQIAHCSVKQYTVVLYNTTHCTAVQCSRVE